MFRLRQLVVAALAAMACVLGLAAPAGALPTPITIVGTGGSGVNMRSGPSTAHPIVGKIAEGASPDFICHVTNGQRIGGGPSVGTTLWWRVNHQGVTGYYSSAYDTVPYGWQTDSSLFAHYGVSRCSGLSVPQVGQYDRQAAVNWALAHAQDVQPNYPEPGCTWFASHVLWSGGLPKTGGWTDGGFRPPREATLAPRLVEYLWKTAGTAEPLWIGDRFATNAVPEAQPGDLIAYSWDGGKDIDDIDHMAVIVNIAPGGYPEVAEWGVARGAGTRSSYVKRGWTWSANSGKWLQEVYPDVTAMLVRIK